MRRFYFSLPKCITIDLRPEAHDASASRGARLGLQKAVHESDPVHHPTDHI